MAQYAVLIYDDESAWDSYSPERQKQVMDGYWAYSEKLTSTGKGNGGEALHPTATATTIRVRDGQTTATDGPFAEAKEALGGFYVIEAADLDEAIALAAECPGAETGAVELRPIVDWSTVPRL